MIAILERIHNTDTIQYAVALHNLGEVYMAKHDNVRAEDLFQRSLAVTEGSRVPRAIVSARSSRISASSRATKDYPKRWTTTRRALTIRERILGADHADIASLLNNMAVIYHVTGDDDQALPLFFRALEIREKTVSPYHTGTLNSVSNIARTYAAAGDIAG